MANRGVNLTGDSYAKPSLFELFSHECLDSVIEPSVENILNFIATSKPEKYGWILEWSDEIFTICKGILEAFFISKYSASFSEKFYGLKRISLNKIGTDVSLSRTQKICSLVCLVVLPYIGKKLEKLETMHDDKIVTTNRPRNRYNGHLVKGYKLFSIINEVLVVYYYILYISGRSKYPTFTLRLLRATLTYSHGRQTPTIMELLRKIKNGSFSVRDGYNLFKSYIINALEIGAFLVQFAKWNKDNYSKSFTALPKPIPPLDNDSENTSETSRYKGLCPICYKTYRHPTTLLTSGYIFCYQCIFYEIQKYRKCPVTNYPSEENDLVRLYTQA